MLRRIKYTMRSVPFRSLLYLGVILVFFASAVLVGCQPSNEATLPPATMVAPSPPSPATAIAESQGTATHPNVTPTASVAAESTVTSTATIEKTPTEGDPLELTILHTNDTYGEVDPCG